MSQKQVKVSLEKQIFSGGTSGIIGGIAMMVPIIALALMMGMPADGFTYAVGKSFGASENLASIVGSSMHFFASSLIGIIFSLVTNRIKKLNIKGPKKGIGLGVVAAIIAVPVLALPIMFGLLPPIMMEMMIAQNPGMTEQTMMEQMESMFTMLILADFIAHIIYGMILGITHGTLMKKWTIKIQSYSGGRK